MDFTKGFIGGEGKRKLVGRALYVYLFSYVLMRQKKNKNGCLEPSVNNL